MQTEEKKLLVLCNAIYIMLREATIPGYMTTAQAAEAVGLTAHRIVCLARAGEVDATKSGNTLLIDAAPWLPEGLDAEMPVAAVAADLARSLDAREREAGIDMLRRLLDGYRNVRGHGGDSCVEDRPRHI